MDKQPAEGQKSVAINKEAVKTLAKAIGLRPAARQLGLNENTLLQWSNRDPDGSWALSPTKPGPASNQTVIRSPSEALQAQLSENSGKIKHNFSKAILKASEAYAEASAEKVISQSRPMKDLTSAASQVHSWEEKREAPNVMVNIALLGVEPGTEKQAVPCHELTG